MIEFPVWKIIRAFFRFKVSKRHILIEVGSEAREMTAEEKSHAEKVALAERAIDAEKRLHFLQANADVVFGRKSSRDTH